MSKDGDAVLYPGLNMRDADEFRKRAEYARQLAAESTDEQIKAFWLSAARDWEMLAMLNEKNPKRP